MTTLLILHAASTLAMTGLIWFVQVVHYPLFSFASIGDFRSFAASHQARTTSVVLPLMSVELATTALVVLRAPEGAAALAIAGAVLLLAIWLCTALVQVPLHRRLVDGFDPRAATLLVRSNWVRTIGWSARSAIALALLGW